MMDVAPKGQALAEWREHWRIAAGASIGVATGYSMYQFSASIFVQPLQESFGWTRGEVAYSHYSSIVAAVLSPFAGQILDRVGVRRPLLVAFALTGIAYLALSVLSGEIWQYYISVFFLQLVGILTTGLAFTRVVASRFVASRGLALAATPHRHFDPRHLPSFDPSDADHCLWLAGWLSVGGRDRAAGGSADQLFPHRRAAERRHRRQGRRHSIAVRTQTDRSGTENRLAMSRRRTGLRATRIDPQPTPALVGGQRHQSGRGRDAQRRVRRIRADRHAHIRRAGRSDLDSDGGRPLHTRTVHRVDDAALGAALTDRCGDRVDHDRYVAGCGIDVVAYLAARYFGLGRYSTIYGLTIMSMVLFGTIGQVGIGHLYDAFGNYTVAMIVAIVTLMASMLCYFSLGPYPRRDQPIGI